TSMGMTCMTYVSQWRMQLARIDLVESGDIVAAVAARAGYQSEASFCRAFRRWYGMPPATYRRRLA
ncbi:MAG: AraC family transcriptional regulator, partial [Myxococcales bacterium]|nr:AraC family transcriptional regulator [Myxococcales bacterium]